MCDGYRITQNIKDFHKIFLTAMILMKKMNFTNVYNLLILYIRERTRFPTVPGTARLSSESICKLLGKSGSNIRVFLRLWGIVNPAGA